MIQQNRNSLYRIYRPMSFNDVAGHQNVVEILQTQLKNQNFGHAFLFSGQRGTGKTSVARIFAKAVNCLNLVNGDPCNQCVNCLAFNDNNFSDVYEIDAASNNGVDEIRNIKANVSTLPIVGQYKVYIIDEVHMLSKAAFNALLKTLEEPPMHVIFILATTEYDKIPQTITSRCQSFNFKKIRNVDLTKRLEFICQKEGYQLNHEVGQEIYNLSDGSLRDALNVLEQLMILSNDHKITMANLKKIFYVTTKEEKLSLLSQIFNQQTSEVITNFEQAKNQGVDFDTFSLQLIKILKEIIEYQLTGEKKLLEELEESDAVLFKDVKLDDLFLLVDNLTDAYAKTRNRSVSFEGLILGLIKSIQNFSQTYHLNSVELPTVNEPEKLEPIVEEEVEYFNEPLNNLTKQAEIVSPVILPEQLDEFNEEEVEPTLIDNVISQSKPKPVVFEQPEGIATTLLELIKFQNEFVLNHEQQNLVPIEFLVEDLINVLRGAVVDQTILLRKDLNQKLDDLFLTDDHSNLLNPAKANQFIVFYNAKVVVASNHELILVVDDQMNANLVNYWLLNLENRNKLFTLLDQKFVIYAISEQIWNETKMAHVRLKNKNLLPNYERVNLELFYEVNEQRVNQQTSFENQDTFDKIADLFGGKDIKIG